MAEALKATTERVEVNGVAYYVTPELAEGFKQQEKSRVDEIAHLKSRQAEPAPVVRQETEAPKAPKYGDSIFEDPDGTLDKFGNDLTNKIRAELRKEYEAEKATENANANLKNFYVDFFSENKDLSQDRSYVELIFERNYAKWNTEAKGDLQQLKKKLANESRDIILKRVKAQHEEKEEVVLEGGGLSLPNIRPVGENPQTKESSTLTDVIKKRQAARKKT
jgi:hypothetical protein